MLNMRKIKEKSEKYQKIKIKIIQQGILVTLLIHPEL
jgi:hypothetical protein